MRYVLLLIWVGLTYGLNGQSHVDSLTTHVLNLTQQSKTRSYNHMEVLNEVAQHIKNHFSLYSKRTVYQKFEVDDEIYRNVITSFGPEHGKRIIVGAHYDAIEYSIGADDNASGVAGLMELARLLSAVSKDLPFRVDLVAYSLSTPPFYGTKKMGSYKHALSLKQHNIEVLGMINLKGIGYFSEEKQSQRYPFFIYRDMYGNIGNFIAIMQRAGTGHFGDKVKYLMRQYAGGMKVVRFKPILRLKMVEYGDHANYLNLDMPAIMVSNTARFRNPNYRTMWDTPSTLNYALMSKVVNMVYQTIVRIR